MFSYLFFQHFSVSRVWFARLAVRALCLACLTLLLGTGSALAADNVLTMRSEDAEDVKWNLSADKLSTLGQNTVIEAEGGVVLERGKDILKADFARYYTETNWVYLKGNVFIRMGRDDLKAEEAEFDLRSKTGWLVDGNVFIEGPHVYFSGEKIVKHWGDRYTFNQAKVTTCDGVNPAWSMTAREAVVEIDGYAQLFHSSFQVKDQGLFYSPFMILPAKTTRQSGFLPPDYGYGSKRGLYYTQPYYMVLDESRDMTFYGGFMTEIGPTLGLEYRSHPFTDEKSLLIASGIYDKNVYKNLGSDPFNSGLRRTNQERYWLRGMSDGYLGTTGWRYRTNIDYVSDQDYLREFDNGPLGFSRSRDALFNMFGRDLAENDQNRVSQAMLFKDWDRFSLVGSLRYEQNPALGNGNASRASSDLVQQLPRLDAFLNKGRMLANLPLEVQAHVTTGYMYRHRGTSGLRTEFFPQLSLPVDLKYLSLIGTAGLRTTWYSNERTSGDMPYFASSSGRRQNDETRFVPEFNVSAFTEANRVWTFEDMAPEDITPANIGTTSTVGLRHQVQPRMDYSRINRVDQSKNPYYISDDRIFARNELTYSITNILTRKRATVIAAPKDGAAPAEPGTPPDAAKVAYDYVDLVRWRIESGYDFHERDRDMLTDTYARRPFIDVLSDLDLYITDWLGYNDKTFVSPHTGKITRHDHSLVFTLPSWGQWVTGMTFRDREYEYRRRFRFDDPSDLRFASAIRLLQNHLSLQLNPTWGIRLSDYRDLRRGNNFGKAYDQVAEVIYSAQCYRFIGRFSYDGYERRYGVFVEIPGLFE